MDLVAVQTEIAARLLTIHPRVFDHMVDTITPPTFIVAMPRITFDLTARRGKDQWQVPVLLAVGKVSDRASRDNLAPFIAGSGSKSVKQVLEAGTPTSFDTIRVTGCEFEVMTWGTVEYLVAAFTLDITGKGA